MFEALETNDILVELSLANTGMTDTAASVTPTLEGHTQDVQMSVEPVAADSQPTAEETKVSHAQEEEETKEPARS